MPNWCDNTLELRHDDPAMIERAKRAFLENRLLREFVPVPQELQDTTAGRNGGDETYAQQLLVFKEQLNMKFFGYKNWYDWCVGEWGTKWDVGGHNSDIHTDEPNFLSFSFQSAWSPPTEAYAKLEDMGFNVYALYYEGGCAFCGRYDGTDECYGIDGNSEWVKDCIPEDIDIAFCISESMAEWESENVSNQA